MINIRSGESNSRTFRTLRSNVKLTEFGIRKAWFAVGKDLKASANKAVLARPRQGRTYIIKGPSGRRRRHIASRPLESHANLSGKLRKSIQWKVRGTELRFGYGIADNRAPDYAEFLEFDTANMAARPTLQNSINQNQGNAEQHLIRQTKRSLT